MGAFLGNGTFVTSFLSQHGMCAPFPAALAGPGTAAAEHARLRQLRLAWKGLYGPSISQRYFASLLGSVSLRRCSAHLPHILRSTMLAR